MPLMSTAHNPESTPMREWKWSPAEKVIAHRAFDLALSRELESVIREAKERAKAIGEASDLWKLESWLTKRRLEIDRKFDFRYSVLPLVFATLLREGSITENDLEGLGQDKLDVIVHITRS